MFSTHIFNLFLSVPFNLIRCARGGGVSQDIENISLDILAQKRLEEGWKNSKHWFETLSCLL